jgi:hypothetical protein
MYFPVTDSVLVIDRPPLPVLRLPEEIKHPSHGPEIAKGHFKVPPYLENLANHRPKEALMPRRRNGLEKLAPRVFGAFDVETPCIHKGWIQEYFGYCALPYLHNTLEISGSQKYVGDDIL